MRPVRLAYLVTHPIQYQAPLLRRIAAEPDIELTALFGDDFSTRDHIDQGFGRAIAWDVKLLDGYRHRFLKPLRPRRPDQSTSFWWPLSADISAALRTGGYDALWVHGYSLANHLAALAMARRHGMLTLLRDDMAGTSRGRSRWRLMAKKAAFLALDRLVDHYLTVGTANARHLMELGIAPEKLINMPYAVDNAHFARKVAGSDAFELRHRLSILPKQKLILFSAKLIPRKRPMDLLQSVAALQREVGIDAALILAGDGESMAELQHAIKALNLRNTHLLGFQTQTELAALYAAADVMVLPSEWEPWGLVVNEAMNGGCAIVASDRIGAALDLIQDNGAIYPVGNVPALTEALRTVLADDATLARMQQRSREIIAGWGFEQDVQALRMALDLPPR